MTTPNDPSWMTGQQTQHDSYTALRAASDARYAPVHVVTDPQTSTRQKVVTSGNISTVAADAPFTAYHDVDPTGSIDLVVPAQVGDTIQVTVAGKVTTASGVGIRMDWFSIGGSTVRSWSDGTVSGISGGMGDLANGTPTFNQVATNKVKSTDLAHGFVTFRLRLVNTTGSAGGTHVFVGTAGGGVCLRVLAVNHRSTRVLMLSPGQAWENTTVQEPVVFKDPQLGWSMVYTSGATGSLGLATAPTASGPWTKYASNPIKANASRGNVYIENGTVYLYWGAGRSTMVSSGPSILSQGTPTTAFTGTGTAGNGIYGPENTAVAKAGSTYYYMFEARAGDTNTGTWRLGIATASSPLGPFTTTIQQYPLTTLEQASNAAYSGPWLTYVGGKFLLYYHACRTAGQSFPTDIYIATSTDGLTWTVAPALPVIEADSSLGQDQAADPFVVQDDINGAVLCYFTGQANTGQVGGIYVNSPSRLPLTLTP